MTYCLIMLIVCHFIAGVGLAFNAFAVVWSPPGNVKKTMKFYVRFDQWLLSLKRKIGFMMNCPLHGYGWSCI